jgi:hypothetical protein
MAVMDQAPPAAGVPEPVASSPDGAAIDLELARAALVQVIQTKIDQRVGLRKNLEQRWLDDLRQYHGTYSPEKLKAIRDAGGCEEFPNLTRPKTNSFIARMEDMLLPTDDKNWGFEPTPVPKLADAASSATPLKTADGQPIVTDQGHPVQERDVAQGITQVAEDRCRAMEKMVDDQLSESGYNAVQRQVIKDMAVYGTGILKGPTVQKTTKRRWDAVGTDSNGVQQYRLTVDLEVQPGCERVSPWNFFPDMTVTRLPECEDLLERHPSTRKDLIELAKLPGFDLDAIRRVLKQGPQKNTLWFLNELRQISNQELVNTSNTMWEVWEYHGPLDRDQLMACGIDCPDDELVLVETVIWFCDGEILKAVLNPADSGDRPYSMAYCEKDDSSIFGFGYPYLLRNPQNVAAAAWRMVIDNAGLSVGPQLIINRKYINPLDGNWKLKPRKVWEQTQDGMKLDDVFKAVEIESHQSELVNLFNLAKTQADVETNLPLIAQGMDSPDQPDTYGGLSIEHNNASVILRGSVKSYDDDVTRTFLPRMYDWNMQHNKDASIKGDWRVLAKGATVLMEKERVAQTILQALEVIQKDPEAGVKINKGKVYDQWFRAMRLDDVMNTEEEEKAARDALAKQQQGGGNSLQAEMLALRRDMLTFQQTKHKDDMVFQVHELASMLDMDEKTLMARLAEKRMTLDHSARQFNAEAQLRLRTGAGV